MNQKQFPRNEHFFALGAAIACLLVALSSQGEGHGGVNGGGIVFCQVKDEATGIITETGQPHDLYDGEALGLTYHSIYKLLPSKLEDYLTDKLTGANTLKKLYQEERKKFTFAQTASMQYGEIESSGNKSESAKTLTPDLQKELTKDKSVQLKPGCVLLNAYRYFNESYSELPDAYLSLNGLHLDLVKENAARLSHYGPDLIILNQHEVLYRHARIKFKDSNSSRSRTLLAYAASDQIYRATVTPDKSEAGDLVALKKFEQLRSEFWANED